MVSSPPEKTIWQRALPCLVAGWLYVPVLLLVIRLVPERVSENVLALLLMSPAPLLFLPFWAYGKRWLSARVMTLLYTLPMVSQACFS